jgi:RHS repeat-associated protein
LNTSGAVVERFVSDAFGGRTVLNGSWVVQTGGSGYAWLYGHQGLRYDTIAGVNHARHRDYSPTLGRWISGDPLGFGAGDANLYRFVGNAPFTYTDPSGQIWWVLIVVAIVAFSTPGAAQAPGPNEGTHKPPVYDPPGAIPGVAVGAVGAGAAAVASGAARAAAPAVVAGAKKAAAVGVAAGEAARRGAERAGEWARRGWQGAKNVATRCGEALRNALGGRQRLTPEQAEAARQFFTGRGLENTPENIAALRGYLGVARRILEKYEREGYTGVGVETQTRRIEQILQQLRDWGVRE